MYVLATERADFETQAALRSGSIASGESKLMVSLDKLRTLLFEKRNTKSKHRELYNTLVLGYGDYSVQILRVHVETSSTTVQKGIRTYLTFMTLTGSLPPHAHPLRYH